MENFALLWSTPCANPAFFLLWEQEGMSTRSIPTTRRIIQCRYEFMQARLLFADHTDFLFVVLDEEARRACRTGLASDVVGGDMLIMCEGLGDGPLVDRISCSIVGSFLQPGMLSFPQFRG